MNRRFARTIIFFPPAQGVGAYGEETTFGAGSLALALIGGLAVGATAMYLYRQSEVHALQAERFELRERGDRWHKMWGEYFDEAMNGREKIKELAYEKNLAGRAADEYARDLRAYEATTEREVDAITLGRPPVRAGQMWASPEDLRAARRAIGMEG